MIYKIVLNDNNILEGSIYRETDTDIWLDEFRAFGDIIVISKNEIKEILEIY